MADKSTKFGMRLPHGLLINISLGTIRHFKKINILGSLREGALPEIAQSISQLLDMLAS